MIELEKVNKNIPRKDKWETLNVIPLMTFTGVNHSNLHYICKKKWFVFILQTKALINLQFVICLTLHLTVTKYSENKLKIIKCFIS